MTEQAKYFAGRDVRLVDSVRLAHDPVVGQ